MAIDALRGLSSIVPFRYLEAGEIDSLEADSALRHYARGEYFIRQGDEASNEVFVLLDGSAESVDEERSPPFRLNVIDSGSYFGERSCLFDAPRLFAARALEPSTCLVIPGGRFLDLLASSRPFAQAFGTKLRDGLGLFDAFDRFNAELSRSIGLGHIEIRRMVELYKALEPALHPYASDEARIDWGALAYAARRLPENVTRSFVFLLTDNLPTVYAKVELLFPFVPTEARHRFVYEMMPGKDIVLVRDGLSDLADFVTCLCAFAVEARKLRYRLNHPDLIREISRLDASGAPLDRMPFDAAERARIRHIWPAGAEDRVREIVFHRQAYSVDVRKQVNNYNGRLSELWADQVGEAAERLTGTRPSDFPDDLEVHIVSSNTHSVSNCLNPYFSRRKDAILEWAEGQGLRASAFPSGDARDCAWPDPSDEVYYLSRPYLEAHPEARRELEAAEAERGIARLPETVTTGISVQLIEAARICENRCSERSFVINIDYAFGEQAEEIMRTLLLLFGRNVRSINVLGKAGSLVGARGDVIAPTAFIEQSNDTFQPLPGESPEALSRLRAALPGREVHTGPLLTVGGTLLQNRAMLQFYRRIWCCIGLEMEGVWYLRAVLEAEGLGVLRREARRRFLYYVSDLPLEAGSNLSERLSPEEGIPPLYAITREMLDGLFEG